MTRVLTPLVYGLTQNVEVPAAPASCSNQFAAALAGCGFLAWRNDMEATRHAQPALFSRMFGMIRANGAGGFSTFGTTFSSTGTLTPTGSTTVSALSISTRTRLSTASTAGSSALIRASTAQIARPVFVTPYYVGGFFFHVRFGVPSLTTNQRGFIGLYGTVADIGNVEPNTIINILGVGFQSSQINCNILHNDGSGTATQIALGATYPLVQNVYDFFLYAGTDTATVEYLLYRLQTGDIASGAMTTNLPDSGTVLAPQIWTNNSNTAASSLIDVMQLYWDSYF